jgi:hypothetical protein
MLDRIGDEVARAVVESHFSPHVHGGGEEFLVLEGVFQDEHGDFPSGYYVRNPPQSHHTPGSTLGWKLWQFDLADRTHVVVDTNKRNVKGRDGVKGMPLFGDAREEVRLEEWAAGAAIEADPDGGLRHIGRSHGCVYRSARTSARALPPTAAACGSKRAIFVC